MGEICMGISIFWTDQEILQSLRIDCDTDSSEDDQIHCLKEGQPCFPAFELFKIARITDEFECLEILEDEEEDDHNEVLIDGSDTENEEPLDDSDQDSENEVQ